MAQGFFKELDITPIKNKSHNRIMNCDDCGLNRNCKSSEIIKVKGEGKKRILIVGTCPEKIEHTNLLKEHIKNIDCDFWVTNAVICNTPDNRLPTKKEIKICNQFLLKTIETYNPKTIIVMGEIALNSIIGDRISGRIKNVSFSDWVGERIPDQHLKKWICPVYDPGYILQNDRDRVLKRNWIDSIEKAIKTVNDAFYIHNYESDVIIIKDVNEAIKCIKDIKNRKVPFAFDYETDGLKPYSKGHKIYSVSISDGLFSYAFLFFDNDIFKREFKKLICSPQALPIAQNIKFEEMWTNIILNGNIKNRTWDTMIGQSVLDNRKTTQLKFWTYIRCGVLSYDEDVDKYLKSNDKSTNSFNDIENAPIDKVLLYNGLDSLFTYKLYEYQINNIKGNLLDAYNLFIDGNKWLLKCQNNGIRLDIEQIEKNKNEISEKLKLLKKEIENDTVLKKWDKNELFEFNKPDKLRHLLFNILKIKKGKKTNKGSLSVDHASLEKIKLPIIKNILEYRKWDKALSTYIMPYLREHTNSIVHPFLNLGTSRKGKGVVTYRSSCDSPNIHNIPKRDEQVKNMIRSSIISRKNHKLVEWDFKGMEVSIAACYNHDPVLIKYLEDPLSDMHRDWASELFIKDKCDIDKKERYIGKNGLVFPEFYGSYYVDIAKEVWIVLPESTLDHLKSKGIVSYEDFENHVQKIESKFWETFSVYAEWKKETYRDYEKKGYVDLFTGFRCYGSMKYNEVINYRIQGTAFHCLLYTLNHVMEKMEQDDIYDSYMIGQIHDSMLGDILSEDENKIDKMVWFYGTQKIKEDWEWIIVPLRIEKESSEINGNWAEMKDCGYLEF